MFTLILFVWRDAQHPEIYADILVSEQKKSMISLIVILNMKNGSSYPRLPYLWLVSKFIITLRLILSIASHVNMT